MVTVTVKNGLSLCSSLQNLQLSPYRHQALTQDPGTAVPLESLAHSSENCMGDALRTEEHCYRAETEEAQQCG